MFGSLIFKVTTSTVVG